MVGVLMRNDNTCNHVINQLPVTTNADRWRLLCTYKMGRSVKWNTYYEPGMIYAMGKPNKISQALSTNTGSFLISESIL